MKMRESKLMGKIKGSMLLICTVLFACILHAGTLYNQQSTAKAAYSGSVEVTELEGQNSVYALEVIKQPLMIDSYRKHDKLLGKLEDTFAGKHKEFDIAYDNLYSTLKNYDKKYYRRKSMIIYPFQIENSCKDVSNGKFMIKQIDGVPTAEFSVVREDNRRGIEVPAVSFYIVSVNKNKLKNVQKYTCAENAADESEHTFKERRDTVRYSTWYNNQDNDNLDLAQRTSEDIVAYVPAKSYFNNGKPVKNKKENVTVIKTYWDYKKYISKRKNKTAASLIQGYSKKYFKKNCLVLFSDYQKDSGMKAHQAVLTKEESEHGKKLVCTFIRRPYYGGENTSSYSTYIAHMKKSELKNYKLFESRSNTSFYSYPIGPCSACEEHFRQEAERRKNMTPSPVPTATPIPNHQTWKNKYVISVDDKEGLIGLSDGITADTPAYICKNKLNIDAKIVSAGKEISINDIKVGDVLNVELFGELNGLRQPYAYPAAVCNVIKIEVVRHEPDFADKIYSYLVVDIVDDYLYLDRSDGKQMYYLIQKNEAKTVRFGDEVLKVTDIKVGDRIRLLGKDGKDCDMGRYRYNPAYDNCELIEILSRDNEFELIGYDWAYIEMRQHKLTRNDRTISGNIELNKSILDYNGGIIMEIRVEGKLVKTEKVFSGRDFSVYLDMSRYQIWDTVEIVFIYPAKLKDNQIAWDQEYSLLIEEY